MPTDDHAPWDADAKSVLIPADPDPALGAELMAAAEEFMEGMAADVPTDDPGELAERVLAAKPATPGPYRSEMMPCQTENHTYSHQVSCDKVPSGLFALLKRADSDFFALAANAAPILAAEVKRLTGQSDEVGSQAWVEHNLRLRATIAEDERDAALRQTAAAGDRDVGRGEVPTVVLDALQVYARPDFYLFLCDYIGRQTDPTRRAKEALAALGLPPRSAGEGGTT